MELPLIFLYGLCSAILQVNQHKVAVRVPIPSAYSDRAFHIQPVPRYYCPHCPVKVRVTHDWLIERTFLCCLNELLQGMIAFIRCEPSVLHGVMESSFQINTSTFTISSAKAWYPEQPVLRCPGRAYFIL